MSTANLPSISDLSTDQKRALLAALARDLTGARGGRLSIHGLTGEVMIYMPPPDARERAGRAMRDATAEEIAEMRRRAADLDNTFSVEEALQLPEDDSPESDR